MFIFNDGGRSKVFPKKAKKGDCVVRAISIAAGKEYGRVWHDLQAECEESPLCKANGRDFGPDHGIAKPIWEPYVLALGWKWIPTMARGTGTYVHVDPTELPIFAGPLILRTSRHLTVMDAAGNLQDTHDCSRDGTRAVYGVYVHQSMHAKAEDWLLNFRRKKIGR
jgi:hypothetical protein